MPGNFESQQILIQIWVNIKWQHCIFKLTGIIKLRFCGPTDLGKTINVDVRIESILTGGIIYSNIQL